MTPTEAVEAAFERIEADGREGIWISLASRESAIRAALEVERRQREGYHAPLAGLTLGVKDNIDVAGLPTTAGCAAYGYTPTTHAPSVAALVEGGAVVVGKTNMDAFATGLVGTRSGFGICPNAHWPELIAGGSSSGSAVAVAAGMVDIALGTDTAGSGRVPAACNGIVGLKPTRGSISATGVVPACRSLDTVSVLATTVATAATATWIAQRSAPDPTDPWSRARPITDGGAPRRVGVPASRSLDFDGDALAGAGFERAVDDIASAGFDLVEIDLDPFVETGQLLYGGAFVAERYEAVGDFVAEHRGEVHPVVADIILAAKGMPAWRAFRDRTVLEHLRKATELTWMTVDAIVVPSVPRVPTVAEVLADPIGRNSTLGTYTNFVNLLDLCALTIPANEPVVPGPGGQPPFSFTLIAPAWHDDDLVRMGRLLTSGTPASPRTA